MTATYYDREVTAHIDGTPIFKTDDDERNESDVAAVLSEAWGCAIRSFGRLAPVDWYAERDGRVVGLLELKSRTHLSTQYATVFLNVRKWLALMLAACGMGVPSIFVVRFVDGVWWVPVAEIDARGVAVGGCVRVVKSRSDVEPVIEVPVETLRLVA